MPVSKTGGRNAEATVEQVAFSRGDIAMIAAIRIVDSGEIVKSSLR